MTSSSLLLFLGAMLFACSQAERSPETRATAGAAGAATGAPAGGNASGGSMDSAAGGSNAAGSASAGSGDDAAGVPATAGSGGGGSSNGGDGNRTGGTGGAHVLDPSQPPGQNYDLSGWALQLPIASGNSVLQIKDPELKTYSSDFFYTTKDSAIGVWCPVTGATTPNSHYPRTELRELPAGGDWSIDGFHHLHASFKMLESPASKGTVIGQIHGNATDGTAEVLKLEWTSGNQIVASVEANDNPATQVDHVLGSYQLSQLIQYDIQLKDGTLSVVVLDDSGAKSVSSPYTAASWKQDRYYFKLGAYVQLNTGPDTDGGRVAFYSFNVEHAAP